MLDPVDLLRQRKPLFDFARLRLAARRLRRLAVSSERRARGLETMKKVYAGDVPVPPEGASPFADIMLEQVFAEVWTRPALSVRDRRLLIMGVIASMGESVTWGIQLMAALKNGELTPEQVREALIQVAQYAGYPRAAGLMAVTEQTIAKFQKGE